VFHHTSHHLVHALDARSGSVSKRPRGGAGPVPVASSGGEGTSAGLVLAVFVVAIAFFALVGIALQSFGAAP